MATPTTLPSTFVAGNVLTAAQMNNLRGAFRVLQVVSTAKTDTFSLSTDVWTDITGLSVSITPSATASKILVLFTLQMSNTNNTVSATKLVRGSTDIFVADTAGNRTPATAMNYNNFGPTASGIFLDSPATTSPITYKLQLRANDNNAAAYVNRSAADTDSAVFTRTASSITVMEISA